MSRWAHITSCISVDTYHCSKTLVKEVKAYLKDAPKITGSEGDADIFVNHPSGFNVWANYDCKGCKYGKTIRTVLNDAGEECEECDAPDSYHCPESKYQTCVVISIQGDLRDKGKEETQAEFDAFKKYVEKKYDIRDYSLNIEED